MSKIFQIILMLVCIAVAIFGIVMMVMAVRFMELGRVIFYFTISMISLECALLLFMKLRKPKS